MNNYKVVFETDNIRFIKIDKTFINDYLKMVNDPEIQKMIYRVPINFTYEGELEWIDGKLKNDAYVYTMIDKVNGDFIGNVELMDVTSETAEMGICITGNMQDKRYGSEAIKKMIDFSFEELELDYLTANVFSINKRSLHCIKKFGFEEYDVIKNIKVVDDEQVDEICLKKVRG